MPATHLTIGINAYVIPQPPIPNSARPGLSKNTKAIGYLEPGERIKIIDSPKCSASLDL